MRARSASSQKGSASQSNLSAPLPRHGAGRGSLVIGLLAAQLPAVPGHQTHPGRRAPRIVGGEVDGGVDVDTRQQLPHVRARNPFGFQLFGAHATVEQRNRAEIFQVVVGLLLGAWIILGAVRSPAREVIRALEDLEGHPRDVLRAQLVLGAQAQDRVDHDLSVDERAVLLQVGLFDTGEPPVGGGQIDGLAEELHQAVRPSNTDLGPVTPRAASIVAYTARMPVMAGEMPCQLETGSACTAPAP